MAQDIYYLNRRGSRWVVYINGEKPKFYVLDKNGNYHLRTAQFFGSFGNWTSCYFNWKGCRISGLPEACDQYNGKLVIKERDYWTQSAKHNA
jgi:hypothetical protein